MAAKVRRDKNNGNEMLKTRFIVLQIILYNYYLVFLHQNCISMEPSKTKGVKVVHVHMLSSHKNYYFSSVRSLFTHLTAD